MHISDVNPPQEGSSAYLRIKPIPERLIAAALLLASAPVVLLAAGLVRLTSPGPAFYSQARLGRHGRPFSMYKIRTMQQNCEAATGPVWARADDPRVTAVGRLLRRTHLDELPQLWNVLRGEMSLIGPRPERPEIVRRLEQALPGYRTRLLVPPGMTGLAQVLLPADSDLESVRKKLELDLHYVRAAGPVMDLRIALATPLHLLAGMIGMLTAMLVGSCRRSAVAIEAGPRCDDVVMEIIPSNEQRSAA